MTPTTDYQRQGIDFLARIGIKFSVTLVGSDCPPFCADEIAGRDMDRLGDFPRRTHIHGRHYRVTFTRPANNPNHRTEVNLAEGTRLTIDFWNSYKDEEFNWLLNHVSTTDAVTQAHKTIWFKKWEFYDQIVRSHGFKNGKLLEKRTVEGDRGPEVKWVRPNPKVPTPYDVLAAIDKYDPGTFRNFCVNFGYDEDSRRALAVWEAVSDQYQRTSRFFTATELEEMQEIQ